jgi:hypothetical protein
MAIEREREGVWPMGVDDPPMGPWEWVKKKKKTRNKKQIKKVWSLGVVRPPHGPQGWFDHSQTGHGGGLFFFFNFFFLKVFSTFFLISFIIFIFFLHYDTCPTVSFWTEKLMEVPSPSFFKTQVLSMIRIKAYKAKNKEFKPQVSIPYLTLK